MHVLFKGSSVFYGAYMDTVWLLAVVIRFLEGMEWFMLKGVGASPTRIT